ncbi:MAG TPA: cytochrome c [Thermomicrobiaceae bacterium]|nr:cytochrome c [Thermomicrobiaceae bacterium]
MSRLGPLAAVLAYLRAVRRPIWLLLAAGLLLGIGAACDHTNEYPIDFFMEMHYEKFWRSQEPPVLDSPASAVPVSANVRQPLSYNWPAEPDKAVPNYSLDQAKALTNPVPATAFNLKAGQDLFIRNCVQCHGAQGLGGDTPQQDIKPGINQGCDPSNPTHCPGAGAGGQANAFLVTYFKSTGNIPPANLTSDAIKGMSDGELFYHISNGIVDMPPFGNLLTPEQRWALVHYIRQLQGQG